MNRRRIALTFDDGPSNATGRILSVLQKANAKATFFVVGERVASHERQLRRMAAGGFQIGNHTWSHEYISRVSPNELQSTILRTSDAIRDACGVTPTIMRPPGGAWSDDALDVLGKMGLPAVFWSVDPRDWETRNAQSTIEHVLSHTENGSIVIMHDLYEQTADAAEVIVPELITRGFDLLTIDELAKDRGGLRPGKRYYWF